MKNTTQNILFAIVFTVSFISFGQDRKEQKAEDKFEDYAFMDAISSYEDLVQKGYTSEEIYKNLGNANYNNAKYDAASQWYEKLINHDGATVEPEYLYRYAQSLKSLEKYDESDDWMQKFEDAKANDYRVTKFNENMDYLKKIKESSGRYTIENLKINSKVSDFAPSFYKNLLVFSTARDTGITSKNIHQWNEKSFLNLYSADISDSSGVMHPQRFSKKLNTKTHESSTTFSKDGDIVFFTRNNSENGGFERDAEGISRLKLYRAVLRDDEWTDITELPFNSDDYSIAHPALSPDGTKLYFASDMPGTLGASDIFMVKINNDGTYGKPVNLGDKINTEARENFPFVTQTNVLYFSSDGHPGLGGLDVFATKVEDLESAYVANVGEPVNSEQDDFSFIIDENTGKGFFASNREGGMGSDDIYGFLETQPLQLTCNTAIQGIVKDEKTGNPLPGTKLWMTNSNGATIAETVSEADGTFTMDGGCEKGKYKVLAVKEDYEDGETPFELATSETPEVTVLLKPIRKAAAVGTDLTKVLNLKPIYFDLNKAVIREDAKIELNKVLEYMNTYPEVKIAIGSHTDSRGRDSYNLSLSDKRAKSTVAYLISKGINSSRITGQGYGESKLVNDCGNGVKCSKAEHELNRRSEFIVVE
ncbi:OmpA family protein [Costertonia aggregata]|uniref:OmpA family protein n=1 Tax=Costertonia aggregata TaxID=343403 RepID=A0A7H9AS94_9FLAO|nr:OmpA family protein [Costertonia aggregata]QLG46320.1 OmpA family protein [Costertonia aggregata]